MNIYIANLVLLLLLSATFYILISNFCLDDQRNWVSLSNEFANMHGLTFDTKSTDTSIRFFGNYTGFGFNMEVDLTGGWEAVPPGVDIHITITGVGQLVDSFEIWKSHFLSRKRINFGNRDLDRDYTVSKLSGNNYGNLFITPSVSESLKKYDPNMLRLTKQQLTFSKSVTEKQLEELWVYSNFLIHLGKQINRLNDSGNVETELYGSSIRCK